MEIFEIPVTYYWVIRPSNRGKRAITLQECRARVTQAFTDFYVFLTVNSVIKTNFLGLGADSRRIEMNWTPPPGGYKARDWVGLFRKDAAGFSISGEWWILPMYGPSLSCVWFRYTVHCSKYFSRWKKFYFLPHRINLIMYSVRTGDYRTHY